MVELSKLVMIFVESALELVPRSIVRHPSVVADADRREKPGREVLLDRSYHHAAMRRLRQEHKRGRPDIVHFCLLEALGSILCKENLLEVFVHTLNDHVITINPSTRLPRTYERFKGLMEKLYKDHEITADNKTLLKLSRKTLPELLNLVKPSLVVGTSEKGEPTTPLRLAELLSKQRKPTVLIGAFPKGDFTRKTMKQLSKLYSIYPKPLEAWTVTSRTLSSLEEHVINFKKRFTHHTNNEESVRSPALPASSYSAGSAVDSEH